MFDYSQNSHTLCLEVAFKLEREGRYSEALQLLRKVFPSAYFREFPRTTDFAEALLRYGAILGFSGGEHQEESRRKLEDALSIFAAWNIKEKIAECKNYLANCCVKTGRFREALSLINEAYSLIPEAQHNTRLYTVLIHSNILGLEGKIDEVVKLLESEENYFYFCHNDYLFGVYSSNLGLAYKSLGNLEKAEDSLRLARMYLVGSKNWDFVAVADNNLAQVYRLRGKYAYAHKVINRAIMINRRLKDQRRLASALDSKALIFYDEGNYTAAMEAVTYSIELLKNSPDDPFLKDSLETKRKILAKIDSGKQR